MANVTVERRKAMGVCILCEGEIEPERKEKGLLRCGACQKQSTESRRQANAYKKKHGICLKCGMPKEEDRGEENLCLACTLKQRESYEKATKKKEKERMTFGLCTRCGKPKEDDRKDKLYCLECSKKSSKASRKSWNIRIKRGYCGRCGELRIGDDSTGSLCAVCAEKQREYNRGRAIAILPKEKIAS